MLKHERIKIGYDWKLFGLCSLAVFLFLIINNDRIMWADANDYYIISQQFNHDSFSLTGFSTPYRGYVLPLIFYVMEEISWLVIGDFFVLYWLAQSITFSFLLIYLIPSLLEVDYKKSMISSILHVAACAFFFSGLLIYTLSDMFGLVISLLSVWLYLKSIEYEKISLLLCLGAGLCMAMAYYLRPIYLITYLVLIVFAAIRSVKYRKWDVIILLVISSLVAIPQIMINHANFGTISPFIQTQIHFGESLYLKQLFWGITVQRYETNVNFDNFDGYRVVFEDSIGVKLLEQDSITSFTSYFDYIVFVVRHFVDVCIMYIRHLFNGLDIVYTNVYVENVYTFRFFVQLMNYVLLFFGCSEMYKQCKKIKFSGIFLMKLLAFGLPIVLVIPTAVECRFFTLLSCLIYYFAVNSIVSKIRERERITWIGAMKLCTVVVICFLLNAGTFQSLGIPLW